MPIKPAGGVHQRPAAGAAGDGGVGLDHPEEDVVAGAEPPVERGHDPHGHRGPPCQAQRAAHGDGGITDLQVLGAAEGDGNQAGGGDAQHRQVGGGILAHDLGRVGAPPGEDDPYLAGAVDHVLVGDQQTVGPQHHPRTAAFGDELTHRRSAHFDGDDRGEYRPGDGSRGGLLPARLHDVRLDLLDHRGWLVVEPQQERPDGEGAPRQSGGKADDGVPPEGTAPARAAGSSGPGGEGVGLLREAGLGGGGGWGWNPALEPGLGPGGPTGDVITGLGG